MPTIKDHPREIYPEVAAAWTGPPPSKPAGSTNPDDKTTRWEWDKTLTGPEAKAFDDIVDSARRGLTTTEYTNISADLALCRDFLNIQNPTTAQNAAAIKAIIRSMQERFRTD